jgi:hypothetical protein
VESLQIPPVQVANAPGQLSWAIYSIPNPDPALRSSENPAERRVVRHVLVEVEGLPQDLRTRLFAYFIAYSQANSGTTYQAQYRILEVLFSFLAPHPVPPFYIAGIREHTTLQQQSLRTTRGYPSPDLAYSDPPAQLVLHNIYQVDIVPSQVDNPSPLSSSPSS